MTVQTVRLPDVGEGIAEAELVAWHVAVGDAVTSDTVIAEVLTDKATVEIYAPFAGTVSFVRGEPGDVLAVGGDFIGIETGSASPAAAEPVVVEPEPERAPDAVIEAKPRPVAEATAAPEPAASAAPTGTVAAAPAVRQRALDLGIDIDAVAASGPDGRVTHADLDRHLAGSSGAGPSRAGADATTTQVPLIGLRRKIAARMTASLRIPHITYVEEIDVTQLEQLRRTLASVHPGQPRLTLLPFVMQALVLAVGEQPHLNSTLDDTVEPAVLSTHGSVDIGIATQTDGGLIVPVARGVQRLDLWQTAAELIRVTAAAREGTAVASELSGSSITITSLGALGGIATTPIINHPEVAIVGINKMQTRPVWIGGAFVPRQMMNVSASFDHRVVDGYDAAVFIQAIKSRLEEPALLFIAPPT